MNHSKMNMNSLATVLLTSDFSMYDEAALSTEEWYEVERILKIHGFYGPASLFDMSHDEMVEMLGFSEYVSYKISCRMRSIPSFLKVLTDYDARGIRIITKYDEEYPKSLQKKLKKRAPVCLYVIGKIPLDFEGMSIHGLQESNKKDRTYTKRIVDKMIAEDKWLISEYVKGVDYDAMRYAIMHKCNVMIFLCDKDMFQVAKDYRRQIKNGDVVLLSAVDPLNSFDVTNCLDRNSYVCGLSKYEIIVSSKINSGALWFTTMQNMHHNWTKTMVLENQYPGNIRLLEMKTTPIKVKDVLSDMSFEMIYDNNQIQKAEEINIDQMSIFEFLGDKDE